MSYRTLCSIIAAVVVTCSTVSAQSPNPNRGGYVATAPSVSSAEERSNQTDLWVLEVDFKPIRMLTTTVTDPQTGEQKDKNIWYLVYRAVNRPVERRSEDELKPVNPLDAPVNPPMFIPEFILVSNDNEGQVIYPDQIIPEAQAVISRRERLDLKNSVSIVQPVPDPVAQGKETPENMLYGVVMWTDIDPATDRFTLFASGFSNGFHVVPAKDGGEPIVLNKTIMQKYWRPGDEFDETEREVRLEDDPQWIYR